MSGGDHAASRRSLGAYALGALDPAERAEVEAHLEGCPACRDELSSLAVLPGLLSRLSEEEVVGDHLSLPDGHADRVVAAVGAARRSERRRLAAWRAAAAIAAATAALLAVVVAAPWQPSQGAVLAAEDDGVRATATVVPRDWGMQVELRASGLPDARGYTLRAVAEDGHHATVATWSAVDHPEVSVTGSCYLAVTDLAHLEIVDTDETVLLRLGP